jgi:hypothetical protein
MKQNIRVYDIDYLFLSDDNYAEEFIFNNGLIGCCDEIKEHIEHLNQNRELIFKFEDWYLTQDEWNDKEHMEGEMVNLIEQETGEYFTGFSWEYLVESN